LFASLTFSLLLQAGGRGVVTPIGRSILQGVQTPAVDCGCTCQQQLLFGNVAMRSAGPAALRAAAGFPALPCPLHHNRMLWGQHPRQRLFSSARLQSVLCRQVLPAGVGVVGGARLCRSSALRLTGLFLFFSCTSVCTKEPGYAWLVWSRANLVTTL
jgi:hypothetical protein